MSESLHQPLPLKAEIPALFHISPLIRITLLSLYVALTLPLPFLSEMTAAPIFIKNWY